ncbi:right-handed parallel beta-helix repeat-containing protein [uncultured Dokdonia sp.]|uniref:right-handed parallel beta-helix repeat-containing protein n=1 Tax=uncultured Dokdonia sp. TaxID=575653 RepID=UPI0030EBB1FF|tara:strand:+ start:33564 stop:34682 length:1119 start_codon:yes stop_codon:yes gene_type:complete
MCKNKDVLSFKVNKIGDIEKPERVFLVESFNKTLVDPSAVEILNFLPKKFSKIGDVDYTNEIQRALDKNRNIIFPNFPILINDNGLSISSNSTLYFRDKSLLKLKSSNKGSYSILKINNVDNVKIFNPKIEGDRYRRYDTSSKIGEWGMGISLRSSTNITIYNPEVSNCWGDGIYFGMGSIDKPNFNIKILNALLWNNRRNGISIITGKEIFIDQPQIESTYGTNPQAAIDIEPNKPIDLLQQINISNPYTKNNAGYGILIALNSMLDYNKHHININILEHKDVNSKYGLRVAGVISKPKLERLEGSINFVRSNFYSEYENGEPFLFNPNYGLLPVITLEKVNIENKTDKIKDYLNSKIVEDLKMNNIFIID